MPMRSFKFPGVRNSDTQPARPFKRRAGGRLLFPRVRLGHAAEARDLGDLLVSAGFGIAIAGTVAFGTVCLLSGGQSGLDDILLRNALPAARWALAAIALGVTLWVVGAVHSLMGKAFADDEAGHPGQDPPT